MRIISFKSFFILVGLLITTVNCCFAQTDVKSDTTIAIAADSSQQSAGGSFLDDKVRYVAEDSTIADLLNRKAYLYNHAEVYYQDMILKAGYIEIDFEKKLVVAKGIIDSTGKMVQRPVFEQGPEKFTAGQITYNFETKKGKIKNVITQQGDGFIHGSDIKKDTNNVYYVAHGKYTTCNFEEDPHFYFLAKKIKVIPNDKVITGPAELYIADVPTPLFMPFGYFPNKKGRKSGIIIPGYGRSNRLGYFLSRGGFYYGGNEFFDCLLTADVYSNGGHSIYETTNYSKRYKYRGTVGLTYSRLYIASANPELANQPKKNDYRLFWNHSQDARSSPNGVFTASVDFGTSSFGKNNGTVTQDYIRTSYTSRINYYKAFTGTPLMLNVGADYNQNVLTHQTDLTLPEVSLTMSQIYPFKNNSRIGKRWYDQIGINADLRAKNSISTVDTLLFSSGTIDRMQNGARISVPITTTLTIFKYIRITPSINTNGYLYAKTYFKSYNADSNEVYTDTLPYTKFYGEASANTVFGTTVYGDYYFKTKRLKQIHHILTPAINFNYKPDYGEPQYGFYGSYYNDSIRQNIPYPYYGTSTYGGPVAGRSETVGFNLSNTLEAKIKQNTDSGEVFKKVKLLENLSASLYYNAAAEKFKWSNLVINARTRLFDKLDVMGTAIYDLYHTTGGVRTDYFQTQYGHLATLSQFSLAVSTSLRSKEKKKPESNTTSTTEVPVISQSSTVREELEFLKNNANAYIDFDVPWNLILSYNTYYTPKQATDKLVQTFSFSGDVALTKNWRINGSSGFDFKTFKFTTTSINIYRDLHCWELHFSWVPFGYRQTFLLTINVKSSMLKDLQLKRQSQDTQNVGF